MADSLCGPSNALQTFQKHSTVDRTLQQDRLISRSSPLQGFRSSPGPNGGLVESDFQAFQAGNLPLESHQGFQPQPFSHTPQNLQQPGSSGWASDFQRLNISNPQPQFQQQHFNAPPQQRQDTGGWHQDFAQQFQSSGQQAMSGSSQMGAQMGASSTYGYQPMMQGVAVQSRFSAPRMGSPAEMFEQSHHPVEAFDEEAFARAFEEAAQSEINNQQDSQQGQEQDIELREDIMIEESLERLLASDQQVPNQERLGADLIHDPMQENEPHPTHEDPDALSRTAGQLLDSVRNNQSDKFQNSQFLELMRQLRDKEVMVKGDNIVGAQDGGEGSEGIKNELISLFRTLKRLVLDRDRSLASNASQQVRKVLTVSLRLNELNAHYYSMDDKGAISYVRIHRTLQAVINSPDLALLPAIRNLVQLTYLNFETTEKAKTNTPASPLSDELNAVCLANAEITSIHPPSDTALETLIYNYISDSLQSLPGTFNQDPLNALLGYTFRDRNGNLPYLSSTDNPHIQRSREIMGQSISECIDMCRGFWCELLEVERFFELVSEHELHGRKSVEFRRLLAEVERDIEEGLRAGIERARNGHPYYFGVQDLRVRRVEDREDASYENSSLHLDAQRRLRYMQMQRFQREAEERGNITGGGRNGEERSMEEKRKAWSNDRRPEQQ